MDASPCILITDDEQDFRETVREVLTPHGYRTLTASCGEEAFEIVREREVHVVLMDMHMPRLTGLETIQLVKQFKAMLPCILISAQLDEALKMQAEQARAYSVLRKPVGRFELTNVVQAALKGTYGWG